RHKIHSRLRDLPAIDSFPEGGVERLDLLQTQRRMLIDERTRKQNEAELIRQRRRQTQVDHDECARRAYIIESLRALVPRVDAARRVYIAGLERRDGVSQEKRTLTAGLAKIVPPSPLAFTLFIGLIWIGAGGLTIAAHENLAAALGVVSVAAMLWYRDRLKRASAQEQQIAECSARLEACESELRKTETEARQIESDIRKLTGKNEITNADIEERAAELDRLLKLNDDARSMDEAVARCEGDLVRIAQQLGEIEKSIAALLTEATLQLSMSFWLALKFSSSGRTSKANSKRFRWTLSSPGFFSMTCAQTRIPRTKLLKPNWRNWSGDCSRFGTRPD